MHQLIKQSNIFEDSVGLLDMKKLTDEVIELISVKTVYDIMTENIPRTMTQVKLNGLHPTGCSAREVDGGQFHPIFRGDIIQIKIRFTLFDPGLEPLNFGKSS